MSMSKRQGLSMRTVSNELASSAQDPGRVRSEGRGSVSIKANILIVDATQEGCFALARMLEGLNENIVQSTSGADALRRMLEQDFAVVVAGVRMPEMDGYELATQIRNRERTRDVPIVFVGAAGPDAEDVSRGYSLGAADYVFNPVNPVALCAKIAIFVDLYRKNEAIRQAAEQERRLQLDYLRVRTEKIEAERALRQIEERQSLIIRSLPIALYTANLEGRFAGPRFVSETIASMVGFAAEKFIDDSELWPSRIHIEDRPRVMQQIASIGETGVLSAEYRWRCADGSERVFLDQAVLVRDDAGRAKEILGTCLDVTDRRGLERQLLQTQKMEAIGRLTGGIAHDFNNMLSVIIWNLDALTRSLKNSPKDFDRVQMALNGALNCAELIRRLLTFAKSQPSQPQVINLTELMPRIAKMLSAIIGTQIKVGITLSDNITPIFADPAQVESALLNLAINARDAMPDGGTIVLEAAVVAPEEVEESLAPGNYVMLAVKDNGIGMPPEVLERALEPFFTTKGSGEGTGLGLSMVYGFTKQSGGNLKIESKVGNGTTVRLYLPQATRQQEVQEIAVSEPEIPAAEPNATILVVEDDADVRTVTVARLQEHGYVVREADNANAALAILDEDPSIDLLFTDVVMPGGMSGLDLARRAIATRPTLKLLFASGYASTFHITGDMPGEMLQKPYRDEDLRRALGRTLNPQETDKPAVRGSRFAQLANSPPT
jgi:PAS domain S-box-containing protein